MSAGADMWKKNFRVYIKCMRCRAKFRCHDPVIGNEKWPGSHSRAVVVYAPESCPQCKSLHVLDPPPPPEEPTPGDSNTWSWTLCDSAT